MSSASGNGGRGGGRGGRAYNPFTDRYCGECGFIIFNHGMQKVGTCPNPGCRARIRFRSAPGTPDRCNPDIGHCDRCDAYTHKDNSFCTVCKWANSDTVQRKRRLARAQAQQQEERQRQKIRELELALKKQKMESAQLKEVLNAKEEKEMKSLTEEMLLDDDDDEAFASSPAAEKDMPGGPKRDDPEGGAGAGIGITV